MQVTNNRELQRIKECDSRTHQSGCVRVNRYMGWTHGFPIEDCDRCWEAGPDTPEGEQARQAAADYHASELKKMLGTGKLRREVAVALTLFHTDDADRSKVQKSSGYKWDVRRETEWAAAKPSWERARSLGKALLGRLTGQHATDAEWDQRHVSCFGTTRDGLYVQAACPSLTRSAKEGHHYCNACGCGDTELARLDGEAYPKLRYKYLECPRRRPGFRNSQ